jgi:hypothetical protein
MGVETRPCGARRAPQRPWEDAEAAANASASAGDPRRVVIMGRPDRFDSRRLAVEVHWRTLACATDP